MAGAGGEPRLGVDIGRVIIGGGPPESGEDTAFFHGELDDALRTPAVEGAFEALARLVGRFEGRVWLVSKCGPWVQERTLVWLDHHRFYERTGVDRANVRFCRERSEKADHCRELSITDFVDDRLDVLEALRGVVARGYLFGPQDGGVPADVVPTPDWPAVERAVEKAFRLPREPGTPGP